MIQILILLAIVGLIILITTRLKLHIFLTLLLASFLAGFVYGIPVASIATVIGNGFGSVLGYIGLVIMLGTVIAIILERSGAAITMAETTIRLLGERMPTLAISIIGYLVAIPVFCDSGYIILNSLKNSLAEKLRVSNCSMSVALATGLFATHTLVPPTPGPVAAATSLGLGNSFGMVIILGLLVAAVAALAGWIWSRQFADVHLEIGVDSKVSDEYCRELVERYGSLPNSAIAFAPIFVPIALMCLGSIANLPDNPINDIPALRHLAVFLGQPLNALLMGLGLACFLLRGPQKIVQLSKHIAAGIKAAAPVLLITGAGGALGEVLKVSGVGTLLSQSLSHSSMGLLMPFLVAATLKSAQGSSTVAMATTSILVAPLLFEMGLDSEIGRVLTVMAIGAGAMTVSHVNDSYFWVVTQFSKMDVTLGYRAQTTATLIQGVSAMAVVALLGLVLI
ncbi:MULTISPECIES: GntP family permease [unclassified Microbulbifer]|uniref:GntP family permease n=1 Tax=unclassified Microbulbifer TaxID=2619833 RepID=UPI0027E56225|nr:MULTISPECIES: GntP family permease [unclassified Microbulbifer]